MKIRLLVWGLLLIMFACLVSIANSSSQVIAPKNMTKALNASVLLRMKTVKDEQGHRWMGGCSGTYVDPTHILTAAHCFEEAPVEYIWARGPNESTGYPVHLVRFTARKDLALLESPYGHSFVKLADMPKKGSTVFNIGSPFDFEFVVSEGVVAGVKYFIRGFTSNYLITTAMINPGSSGGGAFNPNGELIGVNTMSVGLFGWSGISLAVSIDDVKEFLR